MTAFRWVVSGWFALQFVGRTYELCCRDKEASDRIASLILMGLYVSMVVWTWRVTP